MGLWQAGPGKEVSIWPRGMKGRDSQPRPGCRCDRLLSSRALDPQVLLWGESG